jgi:hypothetical protein
MGCGAAESATAGRKGSVLVLDEIRKIGGWSKP